MKVREIYAKAKEFGIMPESALAMRIRFLNNQIEELISLDNDPCPGATAVWVVQDVFEVVELSKHWRKEKEIRENTITDVMIDGARSFPIEMVVEFKRGVARCLNPQHEDRNPSMYHAKRVNRAICPACGAKFDSIEAYRIIFGTDFKTTVKRLMT